MSTTPRQHNAFPHHSVRQAHVDIGALAERVSGQDRDFISLADRVESYQRETNARIEGVSAILGQQLREITARIEAQGKAFTDSRATSWSSFFQTASAVVGVIAMILSPIIISIKGDISANYQGIERLRETSYTAKEAEVVGKSMEKRFAEFKGEMVSQAAFDQALKRVDERYEVTSKSAFSTIDKLEKRVDVVDSTLVKRPEIEAANKAQNDAQVQAFTSLGQRIDVISLRVTGVESQFSAILPVSEVIKELWAGLRQTQAAQAQSAQGK